jgi:hypothetical protein
MPPKKSNTAPSTSKASSTRQSKKPRLARQANLNAAATVDPQVLVTDCRIRILMVCDGLLDYSDNNNGFSELIDKALLTNYFPGQRPIIYKAHRNGPNSFTNPSERPGPIADYYNYRFSTLAVEGAPPPLNRQNYTQLWLFGRLSGGNGQQLPADEQKVIAEFMQSGGGVFATGDHEGLGGRLCDQLPRVRNMRLWNLPQAPPANGPTRNDTLRPGYFNRGIQPSDQQDHVPQVIRPKFYSNGLGGAVYPHLLLAYRDGVIDVMPDHMHEGVCLEPGDLTQPITIEGFTPIDEYPVIPGTNTRLSPEVIAVSTTDPSNNQVNPHCFGSIGVYDGHLVNVGRVVVDSTWHHFLNLNLRGTRVEEPPYVLPQLIGFYTYDYSTSPPRLVPTAEYEAIKQYFRNIVYWLNPKQEAACVIRQLLYHIRYQSPLDEELPPSTDPTWENILRAGDATYRTISAYYSPAYALDSALTLIKALPEDAQPTILQHINTWQPASLKERQFEMLADAQIAVNAILGGAMLNLVKYLPDLVETPPELLMKLGRDDDKISAILTEGVNLGLDVFAKVVEQSSAALQELSKAIRARAR